MLDILPREIRPVIQELQSNTPLASIVFCARNEAKYLSPLLRSLTKLQVDNIPIEIIGVDNGSGDETYEMLHTAGIKVVQETKVGLPYARERGVQEAKGRYVLQTDADTSLPPLWVQKHLELLTQEGISVVLGGVRYDQVHWMYKFYEYIRNCRRYLKDRLPFLKDHTGYIMGANMSYPKALMKEYKRSFESHLGEDIFTYEYLIKYGNPIFLSDPSLDVITSGRRFDTFGKTFQFLGERIQLMRSRIGHSSEIFPPGHRFEDIR